MNKITIITPTYNRAEYLPRLYNSLLEQTDENFEWLVIDDGSEDNSETLINRYIRENKIRIRYYKQANGGKHRALNAAISKVMSELIFIVDSDDFIPINSIQTILEYHNKYKDMKGICGYSFLRCYPDGKVNDSKFSIDESIDTYVNIRVNGHIGGDKAEVFFTRCLKEYPFPEFENEKFVAEDIVWVKMSEKYKMVHINECIYISEYLEGGLTKSGRKMKMKSPVGMYERARTFINFNDICITVKVKMMLLLIIYGKLLRKSYKTMINSVNNRLLFIFLFPFGVILKNIWVNKYIGD